MENSWDVAIVGGGVVGAAAAYHLSRFDLKIGLLEKRNDVCFGVSKANSGIVHGGFHYDAATTVKGRLERRGNFLFDAWSRDLGFPFVRCGILVVAFAPEQQYLGYRVAAKKGEVEMAVGNVIGSNIFNILLILGTASSISPISFLTENAIDIGIVVASSALVYLFSWSKERIVRWEGALMILGYAGFMAYAIIR